MTFPMKTVGAAFTPTEQRMSRWLGALFEPGGLPENEQLTLALVHAAVDQSQRTLRTWRIGPDRPDPRELGKIVASVDAEASDDASEMGGMQRYLLRAQVKGKEVGSVALRYNIPGQNQQLGAVDSEPASLRGLLAQEQRHCEGLMRLFIQGFGGAIDAQQNIIAAQKAMLEKFHGQQAEIFTIQKQLASGHFEREIALQAQQQEHEIRGMKEGHAEEMKGAMLQKLLDVVPLALHHLTNGKLGQSPNEFAQEQERKMFASMDEAMFNVWLAQNVPENERAEMTERYRAARGGQQTPVADEQRPPDDPNRARATAETAGQVSDAQIAAFGAALFGTLDTQTLTGLAPSLASRVTWDQLPHDHRAVMTGMAIHALGQVIKFAAGGWGSSRSDPLGIRPCACGRPGSPCGGCCTPNALDEVDPQGQADGPPARGGDAARADVADTGGFDRLPAGSGHRRRSGGSRR